MKNTNNKTLLKDKSKDNEKIFDREILMSLAICVLIAGVTALMSFAIIGYLLLI